MVLDPLTQRHLSGASQPGAGRAKKRTGVRRKKRRSSETAGPPAAPGFGATAGLPADSAAAPAAHPAHPAHPAQPAHSTADSGPPYQYDDTRLLRIARNVRLKRISQVGSFVVGTALVYPLSFFVPVWAAVAGSLFAGWLFFRVVDSRIR